MAITRAFEARGNEGDSSINIACAGLTTGRLLVVLAACTKGTAGLQGLSCSGLGITWTEHIQEQSTSNPPNSTVAIYTGTVGGTTSGDITVAADNGTSFQIFAEVHELTGASGVLQQASNDVDLGAGTISATFGSAPASDSLCIGIVCGLRAYSGAIAYTAASSATEIYEVAFGANPADGSGTVQTQDRTGGTAAFSWTASADDMRTICAAVEIGVASTPTNAPAGVAGVTGTAYNPTVNTGMQSTASAEVAGVAAAANQPSVNVVEDNVTRTFLARTSENDGSVNLAVSGLTTGRTLCVLAAATTDNAVATPANIACSGLGITWTEQVTEDIGPNCCVTVSIFTGVIGATTSGTITVSTSSGPAAHTFAEAHQINGVQAVAQTAAASGDIGSGLLTPTFASTPGAGSLCIGIICGTEAYSGPISYTAQNDASEINETAWDCPEAGFADGSGTAQTQDRINGTDEFGWLASGDDFWNAAAAIEFIQQTDTDANAEVAGVSAVAHDVVPTSGTVAPAGVAAGTVEAYQPGVLAGSVTQAFAGVAGVTATANAPTRIDIAVGAQAAEVVAEAVEPATSGSTTPPLTPVVATFSGARLLNLDGTSTRSEGVRFDLLNAQNGLIGVVHPQITVDVTRGLGSIKRTLQRFILPPDEQADIDLLSMRVQPWWVLETGDEYSLGIFLFASADRAKFSFGDIVSTSLADQGFILSQKLQQSIGFTEGDAVSTAIQVVLDQAGITNYVVASTPSVIAAPVAWAAGRDDYAKVLTDLCRMGGLLDWYFDNLGVLQIRSVPDTTVDANELLLAYGEGDRIIAGTITEVVDPLTAPNRYLIVDTSSTTNAVVGVYDVPAEAPHSFANRGFYITSTIEVPGVGDIPQALVAAEAIALQDLIAYDSVSFTSSADPRHDTFDLVSYMGEVWIETAWSLSCAPGGPMRHSLKRVYVDE